MKKICKSKFNYHKSVNNLSTKIFHTKLDKHHIVDKDLIALMEELSPVYQELDNEFSRVDLIDLIYYERWLNG